MVLWVVIHVSIVPVYSVYVNMNTCILDLPVEVLRLIPCERRTWQLLCLTCHTLEARLGDYGAIRGVTCINLGDDVKVSYQEFITTIIADMNSWELSAKQFAMFIKREDAYWVLASWDGAYFNVFPNGPLGGQFLLAQHLSDNGCYVAVGEVNYGVVLLNGVTIEQLLAVIYSELPHLFSKMTIVGGKSPRQ